ncbi:MAG TPA: hypothetical protein CFH79_03510 [Sulfurospirillum sp. UBA11407]|nr:MAG TPA: hypothetical protein CFH79_03510 [Sulfurospirillum sp. UBA11407]
MRFYKIGMMLLLCSISFAGEIINIQTSGNLESKYTLGCADVAKIRNIHTPADLYKSLASCIKEENYERAIYYYAVAGAYGYFDAYRVSDKSARQAITVLKMLNFQDIEEAKKVKFLEEFKKHRTSPKMKETCKSLFKLGKPDYYPRYMIEHGIQAFTNSKTDGLLENYNADTIWDDALFKYVKCEKNAID